MKSGQQRLTAGKHMGKSFEQLFLEEPDYCQWVVDQVLTSPKSAESFKSLAIYVLDRRLDTPGWDKVREEGMVQALRDVKPGCLEGKRFVITGEPASMSRPFLQAIIRVLGGKITLSAGKGAKTEAPDFILLAGTKSFDGKPVEDNKKLCEARQNKVKEITLEEFLQLVKSSESLESSESSEDDQAKKKTKKKTKASTEGVENKAEKPAAKKAKAKS